MKRLFCLAAIAAALMGHSFTAQAAGVEFGVGQTGDSTMTYRLGMQLDWDKSWWQSDVGRLTGYWSGAYTYWDGDDKSSNHSLSFSPVFVYEFAGQSVKPYVELGVGVAVFATTEVEHNDLGSAFQFEDRFGAGLRVLRSSGPVPILFMSQIYCQSCGITLGLCEASKGKQVVGQGHNWGGTSE